MTPLAFLLPGLWWLPVVVAVMALMFWQRRRLKLSPLRWVAFSLMLVALLNPLLLLQSQVAQSADFGVQVVKPRVLLVEYGGGKTFLGTVLREGLAHTDIITPENLPMAGDMLKRYDSVFFHGAKNLQVYTDYFTDWRSFPNRGKLESVFTEYGVVFDNGTNTLPPDLENYGLVVLATADIKPADSDRLLEYVNKGGRLLVFLHAGGGLAVNPPGTDNPYCILYHHPPFGDKPFPAEWLQRNLATMLRDKLGLRAVENIACVYGKTVVQKSSLAALETVYGAGALFPNANIDGKGFDRLDWTTTFVDYDSAWQPLLRIDPKNSGPMTGHGTPPLPTANKVVGIARQYGEGRVLAFGIGAVDYGMFGIPPGLLLAAAPYVGSDLSYDDRTLQALQGYVTGGGNLVVVGPSVPGTTGKTTFADLLPVRISGPQVAEVTKAVFKSPAHPLLSGMSPFPIGHYRVSSARAGGEVLAADGKNNPALVTSYLGSGRVVYFLPEIPSQATLENTACPEFWRRLLLWLSPSETGMPASGPAGSFVAGKSLPLSLQLWDDTGQPVKRAEVSASLVAPDGVTRNLALERKAAGTYEVKTTFEKAGEYRLTFDIKSDTRVRTSPVTLTASTVPFASATQMAHRAIAFMNGYGPSTPEVMTLPLWQLLVAGALALMLIDWTWSILRGRLP